MGPIELHVFVDGGRVETFYGSETTITTSVPTLLNQPVKPTGAQVQ